MQNIYLQIQTSEFGELGIRRDGVCRIIFLGRAKEIWGVLESGARTSSSGYE